MSLGGGHNSAHNRASCVCSGKKEGFQHLSWNLVSPPTRLRQLSVLKCCESISHTIIVSGSIFFPGMSIIHSYWTVMSLELDVDMFTLLYVIEERNNLCIPWAHGQFIGTQ